MIYILYSSKNSSGVTTLSTVSETSCIEGQMSCKYTSLPSLPLPIVHFVNQYLLYQQAHKLQQVVVAK